MFFLKSVFLDSQPKLRDIDFKCISCPTQTSPFSSKSPTNVVYLLQFCRKLYQTQNHLSKQPEGRYQKSVKPKGITESVRAITVKGLGSG